MKWEGHLRKLNTAQEANEFGDVAYRLEGANVLQPMESVSLNEWVGHDVSIEFDGTIHCRITGQKIKDTFGEGMSYAAWMEHPSAAPSVLHPELSRIHEGIALRDAEWEEAHHNQPHIVYISLTGGYKVGVTRATNAPFRWHDQGAVGALVIAHTPYRQLAGELEVALKEVLSDKTNYRKMLSKVVPDDPALLEWREVCFDTLGMAYESFFDDDSRPQHFQYPVERYPAQIKSVTLNKVPKIAGKLVGIKGQYLIFEDGIVLNIRRHSAYRVRIQVS